MRVNGPVHTRLKQRLGPHPTIDPDKSSCVLSPWSDHVHHQGPIPEAARARVDEDPKNMWSGRTACASRGRRKRKHSASRSPQVHPNESQLLQVEQLAQHACSNIPFKDQLAVFAPVSLVVQLATSARLIQEDPLHTVVKKLVARRH